MPGRSIPQEILFRAFPPQEAVDHFRRKGFAISFDWRDVFADEHARAFTVAKAMSLDVLEDIRDAVDKALANGDTLQQFQRELEPLLRAKGWWGTQVEVDPKDGRPKEVQLGSPRRLETIYDTNLRTSHAAGRWEQIQRTKARRPYLRYVPSTSEHPRPLHRSWYNVVLPADDPWWATHFAPNGWRCKCGVQQLNDRDLDRYGYELSPAAPDNGVVPWTNPRTGETRDVPAGIDPGFDYNPGAAGLAHAQSFYAEKAAAASPAIAAAVDARWPDRGA